MMADGLELTQRVSYVANMINNVLQCVLQWRNWEITWIFFNYNPCGSLP